MPAIIRCLDLPNWPADRDLPWSIVGVARMDEIAGVGCRRISATAGNDDRAARRLDASLKPDRPYSGNSSTGMDRRTASRSACSGRQIASGSWCLAARTAVPTSPDSLRPTATEDRGVRPPARSPRCTAPPAIARRWTWPTRPDLTVTPSSPRSVCLRRPSHPKCTAMPNGSLDTDDSRRAHCGHLCDDQRPLVPGLRLHESRRVGRSAPAAGEQPRTCLADQLRNAADPSAKWPQPPGRQRGRTFLDVNRMN
jgi:hypothetical protein